MGNRETKRGDERSLKKDERKRCVEQAKYASQELLENKIKETLS